MFDHVTRPWHFFVPALLVILGGIFAHFPGWEWAGYLIVIVAMANTGWLVYAGVQHEKLKTIQERNNLYTTMMGLDSAKAVTKVIVDKKALEGNDFSQSHRELQIAPYKLKIFALEVLDGQKMTIREWTPVKDGKLFSDGEWRRLISFMRRPVPDRPDIKFIVQINSDERQGFDLTTEGRRWLENITETAVLSPVLA